MDGYLAKLPDICELADRYNASIFVDDSHAAGYVLWIWPNERKWETESGYQDLLDFGVDGINAADPTVAVAVTRAALASK